MSSTHLEQVSKPLTGHPKTMNTSSIPNTIYFNLQKTAVLTVLILVMLTEIILALLKKHGELINLPKSKANIILIQCRKKYR